MSWNDFRLNIEIFYGLFYGKNIQKSLGVKQIYIKICNQVYGLPLQHNLHFIKKIIVANSLVGDFKIVPWEPLTERCPRGT